MYLDHRFEEIYPFFVKFLNKNSLAIAVKKNPKIMSCLKDRGEQKESYFQKALVPGNEPRIVPKKMARSGFTPNNSPINRMFEINVQLLSGHNYSKICETAYKSLPASHPIRTRHPNPQYNYLVWEEIIVTTLLHELVHFANHDAGVYPEEPEERGYEFENCAGLRTPTVTDSEIESVWLWGEFNSISNPLFPIDIGR